MKKLLLLCLILACGCVSLEAMRTRGSKKSEEVTPRPSKKRKTSPTPFLEEEKQQEPKEKNKEKIKNHESDSEEDEDGTKVSLPLAQFLHQLADTESDNAMQSIALMKDKHLARHMQIRERELALKEKLIAMAIERSKTNKKGITIGIDDVVVKIHGEDEPPAGWYS